MTLDIMRSGDLFRYNREDNDSMVSNFEVAIAEYTGHKYCVAVNSGGSALFLALMAAGVKEGDKVFSNALTFGAVPSSIHHAGAETILIETTSEFVCDLDDFEAKCKENPDVKFFLISHMRGKLADMDAVVEICKRHDIVLIEDCAHSLGVFWGDKHSGHSGVVSAISTQAYKMLNSGEGGVVVTNDEVIAAKCIIAAGGYEKLYLKHKATPSSEVFESCGKLRIPNYSMRMSNLSASVLIPQVALIEERRQLCNRRYAMVAEILEAGAVDVGACLEVPPQHPKVDPCNDSIQYNLLGYSFEQVKAYVAAVKARGVPVSIFGSPDNARNYRTWHFLGDDHVMPQTDMVIKFAIDVRLPPEFTDDDFELMCRCLLAGFEATGPPAGATILSSNAVSTANAVHS